jgi:hypothetical protein
VAAEFNHLDVVKYLVIELGLNVEETDNQGKTIQT